MLSVMETITGLGNMDQINTILREYHLSQKNFENQLYSLKDVERQVLLKKRTLLKHLKEMRAAVKKFDKLRGGEGAKSFLDDSAEKINEFENILLT